MATPAGWYADPYDATRWRYWDGVAWTPTVSPSAAPPVPPPPPWLPAPPANQYVRGTFRSLRGLSTALLVLFIVLAAMYALLAAFIGGRIALVGRIINGERVTVAEVTDADDAVAGGAIFVILVATAVFILFVIWLWRAYSNLESLGVGPRRYGRGWAIGAWFVPVANLFIPKQVVNDSWRAADERAPGNPRWAKLPISGVFTAWWLTFIVSIVGIRAARAQIGDQTVEQLRTLDWIALAGCLVAVTSCVLGIATVRMITTRQHQRGRA